MGEIYARYNGLKGCFKNTNSFHEFKFEVCKKFKLTEMVIQYSDLNGQLTSVDNQDQFMKVKDFIRNKNRYFIIQNLQESFIADRLSDVPLVKSEIIDSQIEKIHESQIIEAVSIRSNSYFKFQSNEEKFDPKLESRIFPGSAIDRSQSGVKFVDKMNSQKVSVEEGKNNSISGSSIRSSSTESAFYIKHVQDLTDNQIDEEEEEQEEIIERISSNQSLKPLIDLQESIKIQHSVNSESSLKGASEIRKPESYPSQTLGLPDHQIKNKFYQRPENAHVDSESFKYGHRKSVSSRGSRPILTNSETHLISYIPKNKQPYFLQFSQSPTNGLCKTCSSPELNFYTCLSCSTSLYCKKCFAIQRHPHAPSIYANPCPKITSLYSKIQSLGFTSLTSISKAISLCDFDYNKSVAHLLSSP